LRNEGDRAKTVFQLYLPHFSTVRVVFGLVLTGKPARVAGRGTPGKGTGQEYLPKGYPCQSLLFLVNFIADLESRELDFTSDSEGDDDNSDDSMDVGKPIPTVKGAPGFEKKTLR